MKFQFHQTFFALGAWRVAAILGVLILIPGLHAQPNEQTVENRFLFVFDTSRDMKPRLEATQKELNTLLATSLSGQLHTGSSIGVWTFSQELRPGDYPMQTWDPDQAAMIASNLTKFVGGQHYGKQTRFEALQPVLNTVVHDSERLTVLIFCDGDAKFSGTPFDDGVNQVFALKSGAQKKAHQPFVIILRSQLGEYVGGSVGLPPQPAIYPQFPPLPAPPTVAKLTKAPPPTEPVLVGSPLIIIGTNVSKHLPPPVQEPPGSTNPPALSIPANAAAPSQPTSVQQANLSVPTPVAGSAPDSSVSHRSLMLAAAGLLGAAGALGIAFGWRLRRKAPSLITSSMNDRK